ncbi:MAG TPA: 8-amino-7-oxononanoate synthase [Candidatus Baltobacteraceae bacterium]|nr:8-amino-7-oxononanoate synthase [Candidatus Baltobacteraceae bacterium]
MPEAPGGAMERRIASEMESLRERAQLRSLEILDGAAGLNLCSNDYLGLSTDPRLKQAVVEAVMRAERVGSTGSRLLSGNSREWEEIEAEFAGFAGTEAALYFGSGYAANIGLLSSLLKPGDTVFSDALNHASLIDGIRLSGAAKVIYPHGDLEFLEAALRERARSRDGGARAIVTETVFSMEGDVGPLAALVELARKYDAAVIVDEAHATGVWGPEGRGIAAELGLERECFAIVHTCGKALASAGAFVCGSTALREHLINRARTFVFSTAMPPYMAGQIGAALAMAREAEAERGHLQTIAAALREGLTAAGLGCGASASQIVPVILGSNEAALHVASVLRREGFAVKAIRPPTVPPGTARIRISLTSGISFDDVRRLVAAISSAHKLLPQSAAASVVSA